MGLKAVLWWSCVRPDHSLSPQPIHIHMLKHTVIPAVETLRLGQRGVTRPSLDRSRPV